MMYVLGVITGICLCIFVAVLYRKIETSVVRTINQLEARMQRKGSIIEPESEDLQDWVNSLKSS